MIKRAFDIFSMHRYQGTDKMLEKNMEEDRPAEILIFLLKLRDNNSISIRDQRTILFLTIYHGLIPTLQSVLTIQIY